MPRGGALVGLVLGILVVAGACAFVAFKVLHSREDEEAQMVQEEQQTHVQNSRNEQKNKDHAREAGTAGIAERRDINLGSGHGVDDIEDPQV